MHFAIAAHIPRFTFEGTKMALSKETVLETLAIKKPSEGTLTVEADRSLIGTLEKICMRIEGRLAYSDFAA